MMSRGRSLMPRRRTSNGSQGHKVRLAQQLLPGIPDEITLDLITPKLPWRTFYVLSSVSPGCKHAIHSGQVYDARVRVEGTETLAVINHIIIGHSTFALGLYSGKDKLVHMLPLIPKFPSEIPTSSQCISLDGKIYVIGGWRGGDDKCKSTMDMVRTSLGDVYVLDVARQRPWEQCKSMGYARFKFGLGVVGGKIYVLGGVSYPGGPPVTLSEVYDRMYNTWHPFESKTYWRSHQQVLTVGEELFIHGGWFSSHNEMTKVDFALDSDDEYDTNLEIAHFLEIYHPGKNALRKVTPFDRELKAHFTKDLFIQQGQVHSMTLLAIDVYDIDEKPWTTRYSYAHAGLSIALRAEDMLVSQCLNKQVYIDYGQDRGHLASIKSSAVVSGNELVAGVRWTGDRGHSGHALICSIGFGTQEETIQWQKVECPFAMTWEPKICSLQL